MRTPPTEDTLRFATLSSLRKESEKQGAELCESLTEDQLSGATTSPGPPAAGGRRGKRSAGSRSLWRETAARAPVCYSQNR